MNFIFRGVTRSKINTDEHLIVFLNNEHMYMAIEGYETKYSNTTE